MIHIPWAFPGTLWFPGGRGGWTPTQSRRTDTTPVHVGPWVVPVLIVPAVLSRGRPCSRHRLSGPNARDRTLAWPKPWTVRVASSTRGAARGGVRRRPPWMQGSLPPGTHNGHNVTTHCTRTGSTGRGSRHRSELQKATGCVGLLVVRRTLEGATGCGPPRGSKSSLMWTCLPRPEGAACASSAFCLQQYQQRACKGEWGREVARNVILVEQKKKMQGVLSPANTRHPKLVRPPQT